MKKLIALLLALSFIVLSFSGCEKPVTDNSSSENLNSYKEALQNDTFGENTHSFQLHEHYADSACIVDVFRSAEQFEGFVYKFKSNLVKSSQVKFEDLKEKYTSQYFEEKIVVVVMLKNSKGYENITNVGTDSQGKLIVNFSGLESSEANSLPMLFVIEQTKKADVKSKFDVKVCQNSEEKSSVVYSFDGSLKNDTFGVGSTVIPCAKKINNVSLVKNKSEYNKIVEQYLDSLRIFDQDSISAIKKAFEKYTEEYFETKMLITVERVTSSGSIYFETTNVGFLDNNRLVINLHTIDPGFGDCMIDYRVVFVEVAAGVVDDVSDIDLYVDNKKSSTISRHANKFKYSAGGADFIAEKMKGIKYEAIEYTDAKTPFGISLYPKEVKKGRVTIKYYPEGRPIELDQQYHSGDIDATFAGYYVERYFKNVENDWKYLVLWTYEKTLIIEREDTDEWWEEYSADIETAIRKMEISLPK